MPDTAFRLVTLGRLALIGPDGREEASLSTRKRKLALVAVLALADRPLSRHVLIEMFWGDQDEAHARHSLSDALSHARRVLGREAVSARQSEVALLPNAPLVVDAVELSAAARAGHAARVVDAYAGPFLDGVYVDGSATFEDWVAAQRRTLERMFHEACESRCRERFAERDFAGCAALAERWVASAPLSADAALAWLGALEAPGGREAGLRAHAAFEQLAERVRRDYDLSLDSSVRAAGDALSERLRTAAAPALPLGIVTTAPAEAPRPAARRAPRRRPVARWFVAAGGAVVAALLASHSLARHVDAQPLSAPGAEIAVATMAVAPHDTASAWLADGVTRLIDADLARGGAVRITPAARVSAAEHELGAGGDATALGSQLGAAWLVTGTVRATDTAYVLELTLHNVASGGATGPYTVSAGGIAALSDAAASRILETPALHPSGGPRLAGVSTNSTAAYYHYVRAVREGEEGRLAEQRRDLDVAIGLDSGFVSALTMRLQTDVPPDTARARPAKLALDAFRVRASEWDRLTMDAATAFHSGQSARADSLARNLVARFPHDPRAYGILGDYLSMHGDWDGADSVYQHELSLDALGADAGGAPCAPCVAYFGLVSERTVAGNLVGAESAARQWLAVQPDLPAAWTSLAFVLQTRREYGAALTAAYRAAALSPSDATYGDRIGRLLIIDHQYAAADSLIALWRRSSSGARRMSALDLEATLERERGEMRASVRTIDTLVAEFPDMNAMELVGATSMAAAGDFAGARRVFEHHVHLEGPVAAPNGDPSWHIGDEARHMSWEQALEADALSPNADTAFLRALADSIDTEAARSYYARDRRLAFHVRGLIAMRGKRYREAVEELERGRWGASGWTSTLAALARAELALGDPRAAIDYLSHAYEAPLDAMGRYVPRTEIDYLMALSYQQAGMPDSSAAYASFVRAAWRHADPEIRAQLSALRAPPAKQP